MYTYKVNGVCAKEVSFEIEDNKIKNLSFTAGCDGNLKGLCSLAEGMEIHTVIDKLKGIHCGPRSTSCPDQLSRALEKVLLDNKAKNS